MQQHAGDKSYLRHNALIDDTPEQDRCCLKFTVWVLWEEAILFKQIPQHALKHVLKKKKKKQAYTYVYTNIQPYN